VAEKAETAAKFARNPLGARPEVGSAFYRIEVSPVASSSSMDGTEQSGGKTIWDWRASGMRFRQKEHRWDRQRWVGGRKSASNTNTARQNAAAAIGSNAAFRLTHHHKCFRHPQPSIQ